MGILNLQKEFYRSVYVKHEINEDNDASPDPTNILQKHFRTLQLNYFKRDSNMYTDFPFKISDFDDIDSEELFLKTFGFYDT